MVSKDLVLLEIRDSDLKELNELLGPIPFGLATPIVQFLNTKCMEMIERERVSMEAKRNQCAASLADDDEPPILETPETMH